MSSEINEIKIVEKRESINKIIRNLRTSTVFVNDKNTSDTRPNRGRDISDGVVCSWRRWR